jgi:hypothetical protein
MCFLNEEKIKLSCIYRMFYEESAVLRENVPDINLHRYNQTYLHPQLNHYGDNYARKMRYSCDATYYNYLLYYIILYYIILCYVMLCCVVLCCVVLCCVVLCCVVLCCVVLCYVMLCYVMLYYIILYYIILYTFNCNWVDTRWQ